MNWTWKAYLKQTLIVAAAVGTVIAVLRCAVQFHHFDWTEFPWCIGCFIAAIMLVDWLKGQKVFHR